MTEKSDSERLSDIQIQLDLFVQTKERSCTSLKKFVNDDDIYFLLKSLRLAWAQNEVMKDALQYYKQGLDGGYQGYELKAKEALKRCEELKGGG